jgi:aspartate/methionine/tyrosine aminotransferase
MIGAPGIDGMIAAVGMTGAPIPRAISDPAIGASSLMDRITQGPQGFRPVPRTGVIYVMTEAQRLGFRSGSADWANLGQGAPETGLLPGSPQRLTNIHVGPDDHEYAPIDGILELKQAVADLYNRRYRQGKQSQYSAENVAISSGGRLALTRLVSTLGKGHVGHFLPDYTAYEELLDAFHTFSAIPMLRDADRHYNFAAADLRNEILGRGLSAVLLSNPCNPTGTVVAGEELENWVKAARDLECTLICDEFYSHYIYDESKLSVSAAQYVDDVNSDPVVIFDGLTKNWRYPGFRVCWTIAPKAVVEALASAGSFLDGGCARPMQRAAIELVQPEFADQEARAIKAAFSRKRSLMLEALTELGVKVTPQPMGGFYCWGDLRGLPQGLNTGMLLFRKALEVGLIIVPGVFFDINPGKRRPDRASRFGHFARFSFGPPQQEVERGVEKLKKLVRNECG